jgi:uncharacterized protein YjbI with pentapeptide repeats
MAALMDLVRRLRSSDNKRVLQAIEELRVRDWLCDGSLKNIPLCHAQMQDADLLSADLTNVDLHQAHLEHADLSQANLTGARLSRANLQSANFSQTVLANADLFKADLRSARNLTDEQLAQARRLWGAIMPDGTSYDGRHNLAGDMEFAKWGRVNVEDPQAMAEFLRIPLETYLRGQGLAARTAIKERAQ